MGSHDVQLPEHELEGMLEEISFEAWELLLETLRIVGGNVQEINPDPYQWRQLCVTFVGYCYRGCGLCPSCREDYHFSTRVNVPKSYSLDLGPDSSSASRRVSRSEKEPRLNQWVGNQLGPLIHFGSTKYVSNWDTDDGTLTGEELTKHYRFAFKADGYV